MAKILVPEREKLSQDNPIELEASTDANIIDTAALAGLFIAL